MLKAVQKSLLALDDAKRRTYLHRLFRSNYQKDIAIESQS